MNDRPDADCQSTAWLTQRNQPPSSCSEIDTRSSEMSLLDLAERRDPVLPGHRCGSAPLLISGRDQKILVLLGPPIEHPAANPM